MAALIPRSHFQALKIQSLCAANVAAPSCGYSQKVKTIKNPTTASLKRGPGGRSSFNGIVCTVFGNTGFIGRHVCSLLGANGTQLILPYRGDFYTSLPLKLCGDLGQVLFHPFHLRDEESIVRCIKHSNVVINLIGNDWETKNFTFDDVHVTGAATLARLCKQHGVEKFIHVSCLNASSEPKRLLLEDGSKFLKSKFCGECAVKEEFPEAVIIRPSDCYGMQDRFISFFANPWILHFKGVPLYKKGEVTEKQPIYVGDVAAGIVAAIKHRESAGRTYQFVGPQRYKLADFVKWIHLLIKRDTLEHGYKILDIERALLYKAKVYFTEMTYFSKLFGLGHLHWEAIERASTSDNIIKGVPRIEDLGVKPITADMQIPWELLSYHKDGHYRKIRKEYPPVTPPTPVNYNTL